MISEAILVSLVTNCCFTCALLMETCENFGGATIFQENPNP